MRASVVLSLWANAVAGAAGGLWTLAVIGSLLGAPLYEAFSALPSITVGNTHYKSLRLRPLISSRLWANIKTSRSNSTNDDGGGEQHGPSRDAPFVDVDKPPIVVWRYNPDSQKWYEHDYGDLSNTRFRELPLAVQQTWNWCQHFILPLQLCPWARASMETPQALQIFVVEEDAISQDAINHHNAADVQSMYYSLMDGVGRRFEDFLEEQPDDSSSIESAAIFFVVFVESSSSSSKENRLSAQQHSMKDFGDFYDWFCLLEETWELFETVIPAPFHPDWSFAGEPESLQFEKRSPHPTISLVSARVVDAAGEAATKQIGKHNEQVLLSKTAEELQVLWNRCLHTPAESNSDDD
jgi:hypothetical protein